MTRIIELNQAAKPKVYLKCLFFVITMLKISLVVLKTVAL